MGGTSVRHEAVEWQLRVKDKYELRADPVKL